MDETDPTASSVLRSRESPSPKLSDFGSFLSDSSTLQEGDLTLLVGGFQTVMGTIANDCPTASPKGFYALAAELERGCVLKVVGASDGGEGARSGFRTCVDDRLKTWCVKCTPMCASARVAPSNIVYQWYGYRSTGIDVLNTEICFSNIIWIYVMCEKGTSV